MFWIEEAGKKNLFSRAFIGVRTSELFHKANINSVAVLLI